jgi:hypothetical protein
MKKKFEVDKITLGKAVYCQKNHECLNGDLPETHVAVTGGETVLCRFKKIDFFCEYKIDAACMCPVRSEIHKKYAVKNKSV